MEDKFPEAPTCGSVHLRKGVLLFFFFLKKCKGTGMIAQFTAVKKPSGGLLDVTLLELSELQNMIRSSRTYTRMEIILDADVGRSRGWREHVVRKLSVSL